MAPGREESQHGVSNIQQNSGFGRVGRFGVSERW